MAIQYNLNPVNTPRKIFSVGDAVSQLPNFSEVYRPLQDFIAEGGLEALGYSATDVARWNTNFRQGVINVGGRPSDVNFFLDMFGGTPKQTDATDLSIEYNSALDFNIYAENDATGTSGTVTGCTFGSTVNGSYTGPYAQFTIATSTYANNGTLSNINVGDQIYIYNDSRWVVVMKKDTTTPYAHVITVYPMDPTYTIQIYGKQPMLPNHVQQVSGYSDGTTSPPHSEWETPGYIKTIQPFSLRTDWETPYDLLKSYQDILTFPIIFDMVTGAELDSFDVKGAMDGRERLQMAKNMLFWTGETMANTTVTAAYYTQKYNGFEGFLTSIFYGGGNVWEFDNTIGFDLDVDYTQIILENDALKKSTEYLLMCSKRFKMTMERRIQNAFKGNSGACTFETFSRNGSMMADIKRYGVDSYNWLGNTLHIKEVSAWSDSRWIGNGYFKNMGIMLPGYGLTDSNGQTVSPVEFWMPKGITQNGMYSEVFRDHMKLSDKASKFSGTITEDIMMSVNGVENMYAIMPKYL